MKPLLFGLSFSILAGFGATAPTSNIGPASHGWDRRADNNWGTAEPYETRRYIRGKRGTRVTSTGDIDADGTRVTGVEPDGTRVTKRDTAAGDSAVPDGTRVTGAEPDGTRVTKRDQEISGWDPYGIDRDDTTDGTRVTRREAD